MTGEQQPQQADVDEVNSQLQEGLKSCRTMVSSYRALLTGEQPADDASNDNAQSRDLE